MWHNAVSQRGGHSICNLPLCTARPGAIASVWAAVTRGRGDASEAERGSREHAEPAPRHGRPGSHAHLHVHRCAWRGRQDTFQLTFTPPHLPPLTHLLTNILQPVRTAPILMLTHLTNTQTHFLHIVLTARRRKRCSFYFDWQNEMNIMSDIFVVCNECQKEYVRNSPKRICVLLIRDAVCLNWLATFFVFPPQGRREGVLVCQSTQTPQLPIASLLLLPWSVSRFFLTGRTATSTIDIYTTGQKLYLFIFIYIYIFE